MDNTYYLNSFNIYKMIDSPLIYKAKNYLFFESYKPKYWYKFHTKKYYINTTKYWSLLSANPNAISILEPEYFFLRKK